MKSGIKTIFALLVVTAFFIPESASAIPTRNYSASYLSTQSVQQGTSIPITVSGDFRQLASNPKCPAPGEGKVPRANNITDILNVRYEIFRADGSSTGIGRTLVFNQDWFLFREGDETLCGENFWEAYEGEANTYQFSPTYFQINVQSLAPGDYYGKLIGQNTKCDNASNPNECSTEDFNDFPAFFTFNITGAPPQATIKVLSNLATNWTITGPTNFWGSGTTGTYSGPGGTYSITADDLSCYSKSITPAATQTVAGGNEITFNITYSYTCGGPPPPPDEPPGPPPPPPQAVPPSCTSAASQSADGTFYLYAYGVANAATVVFPTWSDAGGQDDIVWYNGYYMGNGTWRAEVNLNSHQPGNPNYGTFSSHVYMTNASYGYTFCGTANFTRNQPNQAPIGYLDAANCSIIGGWAFDPDSSSNSIYVDLYMDGTGPANYIQRVYANGVRGDVNAAYQISGNHGFGLYMPSNTYGSHNLYAYGVDLTSGALTNLTNSPINFNCPMPTPTADIKANNLDNPPAIINGGSATISWTSGNVTSCSVTSAGGTWSGTSGSQSSGALTATRTYSLECGGPYGSASDSVTVTVDPPPQTLTTSIAAGSGTITGAGINCPGDCTESYAYGYSIPLTATPSAGYTFSGWGGACSGLGSCTVSMTQARSVTASFTLNAYTLTTSIAAGSGTITGTGISCPGDCSESYNYGTGVTLTATPSTDYVFSGWSGNCSGGSTVCNLTIDAAKTANASFTYVPPFNYSLSNSGNSNAPKTSGTVYTTNTITKTLLAGTTQPVTLSVSSTLPAGVSVSSISNNPCSPNCNPNPVVTLAVAPSAPVGTYPITVTGSPLSKTTVFNLVITGAPISVSCSANPTTALLGQNVTWSATIVGGVAPVTLRWTGTGIPTSPAPSTNPYTRSYSTIGQKTAQLTVTGADGAQSTCPAAAVQINFDPTFEEF